MYKNSCTHFLPMTLKLLIFFLDLNIKKLWHLEVFQAIKTFPNKTIFKLLV